MRPTRRLAALFAVPIAAAGATMLATGPARADVGTVLIDGKAASGQSLVTDVDTFANLLKAQCDPTVLPEAVLEATIQNLTDQAVKVYTGIHCSMASLAGTVPPGGSLTIAVVIGSAIAVQAPAGA
jgi:hypothetical protein